MFTVGLRLFELRYRLGMSQEGMAEAVGVSKAEWVRFEADEADPSMHVLIEVYRLFGVTPNWIVLGKFSDGLSHTAAEAGQVAASVAACAAEIIAACDDLKDSRLIAALIGASVHDALKGHLPAETVVPGNARLVAGVARKHGDANDNDDR